MLRSFVAVNWRRSSYLQAVPRTPVLEDETRDGQSTPSKTPWAPRASSGGSSRPALVTENLIKVPSNVQLVEIFTNTSV